MKHSTTQQETWWKENRAQSCSWTQRRRSWGWICACSLLITYLLIINVRPCKASYNQLSVCMLSFTVFFYPWISMMSQREGIFNMAICEEQPIREKLAQWVGSGFQTEDQTLGLFWTVHHAKPANDSVRCWTIITIKSSDIHLSDAVIGSSVRFSVTERAQLTSRPGLRHRFVSQHLKLMRY